MIAVLLENTSAPRRRSSAPCGGAGRR